MYGFDGELLAEYAASTVPTSPQKEYGYRNGQLLITAGPSEVLVSSLSWTSSTNGWGPVERNRSNGESGAGDGATIRLNGVAYASGLGVHADSDVRFNLAGQYATFTSDLGVDDEVGGNGSVKFQVWADGALLYDSGVMYASSATQAVNVSVAGKNELRLLVTNGGDNYNYDHADWANARLIKPGTYLPFGEELFANQGTRSTTLGYSGDTIRQQFTAKERDNETGLDYFLARYYSSTQGRFTSPDPIYFQAQMPVDPQRFNLYSYVRNNPLILIDPDGEAIRLNGTPAERKRLLQAIKQAVGKKAGQYLYEDVKTDKDGNKTYFVGIYDNGPTGQGQSFKDLNNVTGEIAPIITDTKVVSLNEVQPGANVGGTTIGPGQGQTHGLTVHDQATGDTNIYIAFSPSGPGGKNERKQWEPVSGSQTESGSPIYRNAAVVMGHELGHGRAFMTGDLGPGPNGDKNQQAGLRLENKVRVLRNPHAVKRKEH